MTSLDDEASASAVVVEAAVAAVAVGGSGKGDIGFRPSPVAAAVSF